MVLAPHHGLSAVCCHSPRRHRHYRRPLGPATPRGSAGACLTLARLSRRPSRTTTLLLPTSLPSSPPPPRVLSFGGNDAPPGGGCQGGALPRRRGAALLGSPAAGAVLHHASPREQVRRSEERLLSVSVTSPYDHAFVPTCIGDLHAVIIGDRSNPPLLVLHGHSMSAAFFHLNFDDLVAQGWCVYALDLPGWGRSARPVFRGRTPEDSLDFFLTPTLQALAGLGITGGFGLMAHSLGAYLALELAFSLPPGRVTQMVLVSPAAISSRLAFGRALYFSLPPSIVARRGGLLGLTFYRWKYPPLATYEPTRDLTWQLAMQVPASGDAAVRPMVRIHRERRMVRERNGKERPAVRRVGVVTAPCLGCWRSVAPRVSFPLIFGWCVGRRTAACPWRTCTRSTR
eukprot:TRINITY_DN2873_c0_g1_i2.p1 TRINITY_DN2873_c0_g1~~TRINITY_DN2873_c0_g1_i2.p1  ORF type:complete len:400 (-),score=72.81 TRINITY_DN2873_c0_g1_i2:1261-2460(-)